VKNEKGGSKKQISKTCIIHFAKEAKMKGRNHTAPKTTERVSKIGKSHFRAYRRERINRLPSKRKRAKKRGRKELGKTGTLMRENQ